jgi:hypothetical protein
LRENHGLADFDTQHSANMNFIYELPFGPGRRFAFDKGSPAAFFAGGWSMSMILSYWNGLPFDVVSGIDNN